MESTGPPCCLPRDASQFLKTYIQYLLQKIYICRKLCDIYTSNSWQICEDVYEVMYKTESGHSIWIHMYWNFGYIYYHLDTHIVFWIYILQFGYIYCNLDIYIVFWTYILQFGYISCNLDIYISLFDILILFDKHTYPCRYTDMVPRFGRNPTELCLIFNQVLDFIHEPSSSPTKLGQKSLSAA